VFDLGGLGLVLTHGEVVDMVWAWSGMRGGEVICWRPRTMVADRSGRWVWMLFLLLTPVGAALHRDGRKHGGQSDRTSAA
jgi:hypothetical protein